MSIELNDEVASRLTSTVALSLYRGESVQLELAAQSSLREWQFSERTSRLDAALRSRIRTEAEADSTRRASSARMQTAKVMASLRASALAAMDRVPTSDDILTATARLAVAEWRETEEQTLQLLESKLEELPQLEPELWALGVQEATRREALEEAAMLNVCGGEPPEVAVAKAVVSWANGEKARHRAAALEVKSAAKGITVSQEMTSLLLEMLEAGVADGGTVERTAGAVVDRYIADSALSKRAIEAAARRLQVDAGPAERETLLHGVLSSVWKGGEGIKQAAVEAVREWSARSREELELEAQVASALDAEAQARRLMVSDEAARKMKVRVVAAVRRGEPMDEAVRASLDEWNRQLLRRQVQQTVWDPSGNQSRRMTGMVRFMPFKPQGADSLDFEMLMLIFAMLPFNYLLRVSLVCKRWNSAAADPSWKPELVAYAWGVAESNGLGVACARPALLEFSLAQPIWKLVCADEATLALTLSGEVFHWGKSWLASLPVSPQPRQIEQLRDITTIACSPSGYYHGRGSRAGFGCAAVDSKGALFTWGLNSRGQLLHRTAELEVPQRTDRFDGSWRKERVMQVAVGMEYIAIFAAERAGGLASSSGGPEATAGGPDARPTQTKVYTCGRFMPRDRHELYEWEELRGIPLRQLAAGAFHCVALSTRGELYTWGDQEGKDQSNGNLLGHGPIEPVEEAYPNTVRPRRVMSVGMGPVAEVSCSTYQTVAITMDGRVFAWGDSDGNALGHQVATCHTPHWIDTLRGLRVPLPPRTPSPPHAPAPPSRPIRPPSHPHVSPTCPIQPAPPTRPIHHAHLPTPPHPSHPPPSPPLPFRQESVAMCDRRRMGPFPTQTARLPPRKAVATCGEETIGREV